MNFDTVRCNIRPFNAEDIDAFMAYRNDMDWMKYQGFKGLSKQEYAQALLACWIGYTITPLKARRGYAYEAVSGLICALTNQGINRLKASVAIGNDVSVMLLEKLKFTFLGIEADEQIFRLNLALLQA